MQLVSAAGSTVDCCAGCGAIWLDWFDGDVVSVLKKVHADPPSHVPGDSASGACPQCNTGLLVESFHHSGPHIGRCPACYGVFVPGGAVRQIADASEEPERSGWTRMTQWLQARLWSDDGA